MVKNITFTADETLIDEAREAARAENSTLNEQFRLWLEQYARRQRAKTAMALLSELQGKIDTGGRKFTRDEMNERR
jgi:methylphosphotriester-DNA--protein-cysteine methyltransferase